MKTNIRFILLGLGIVVCVGGCQNERVISPESPSQVGSPPTPPPGPMSQPDPRDLASLTQMYWLSATVSSADPSLACDGRRVGGHEDVQIDLRVDGNTRVVEADIVRDSGRVSHLRGTVNSSFVVTATSVGTPGAGDQHCPGIASETLNISFAGPNYDGCQGYSVWMETQYSFAPGKIVEGFFHESC